MSECLKVYLVFLTSSVNGARKPTFFNAGNIGRDCENDNFRCSLRGIGPFDNIDVALNGSLYGASNGVESTVEMDVMDVTEAVLERLELVVSSSESGRDICEGESASAEASSTLVAIGVSTGFCDCVSGETASYRFEKVFLAVGDVAERVSNLKLVAPLPKIGEIFDVLSDSFGFFAGDGDEAKAAGRF